MYIGNNFSIIYNTSFSTCTSLSTIELKRLVARKDREIRVLAEVNNNKWDFYIVPFLQCSKRFTSTYHVRNRKQCKIGYKYKSLKKYKNTVNCRPTQTPRKWRWKLHIKHFQTIPDNMCSYVENYPFWWLLYMCLSVLGTPPCKLPDKVFNACFSVRK